MRVSKEAKAASYAKIIDEAAYLFRQNGIDATSVADVMSAAGLTHGGFYRHFKSKNELVSAAIEKAVDEYAFTLEEAISRNGARQAIADYVKRYLSEDHVVMRGKGCPLAALAAEAVPGNEMHKVAIADGTERILYLLKKGFGGEEKEVSERATGLLAILIGTLIMARSAGSRTSMKKILSSGRRTARLFTTP